MLRFRHRLGWFWLDHRQFWGRQRGLGGVFGGLAEDVLFLYDRLRLSRSRGLSRARCLLGGTRGRFGYPRRLRDPESFGSGSAAEILGSPRLNSTALLFFLALRGKPFVFVAALPVAALLFFAPLSRASLLLLAPPGGAPLLFVTPLLLEMLGLGGARLLCGAPRLLSCPGRSRRALGLEGSALGVGGSIGSGRASGLLRGAHRILCGTHRLGCALALRRSVRSGYPGGFLSRAHRFLGGASGVGGTLRLTSAFGFGRPRGLLSRAHGFLRRASGLRRPLGFERSVRIGLLLRESLRFRDLACLFGGARGLFGRALRLLRGASRLRSAL